MNLPNEAWIRRMADLEDGLPISAGGAPFRQLAPPMDTAELVRLLEIAELENGCPVSAGGAPFRVLAPKEAELSSPVANTNSRGSVPSEPSASHT